MPGPIERRKIETELPRKGFIREDDDHRYFHHVYNGRKTGAYTYTSHGSKYKVYDVSRLGMMKKLLKLDTIRQVADLLECLMNGEEYNNILRGKGLIQS